MVLALFIALTLTLGMTALALLCAGWFLNAAAVAIVSAQDVITLHHSDYPDDPTQGECVVCTKDWPIVAWPCETVRLLTGQDN